MSDSINRPDDDQDYLEVSDDLDSDMDVIDNDFNEEDEDGIFAPEPGKAKKKSSIKLMLLLVLLAVIAGGGYFFTTLSSAPENIVSPPLPDEAGNTLPGIPQPVSDFANNGNPDSALTDQPPGPQTDIILDQNAGNPEAALPQLPDTNQDSDGVSEANANNSDAPHISDEQNKQDTSPEAPPSAEIPVKTPLIPPAPEQRPVTEKKLTNTTSLPSKSTSMPGSIMPPDAAVNDNHDLAPQMPPQTPLEAAKNPSTNPQPDSAGLASASTEPTEKTPVEMPIPLAAKTEKETKKPKENTDNFYFDAPKGKALLDIPPPSIDPMREPGESIIIVRKPGQKNVSVKGASTPDSNVIVEKSEDNHAIESKLVSANRASGLGMNDSALDFYNDLYRQNSRDPRILMGRAVSLQKLGENQRAIDAYREVLENDPDNAEATTNLMGLIAKSQPAVALENLLNMHEKYPRSASITAQLGVTYAQSGNPQDGLKYLTKASGLDPKNPLHYYNLAVVSEKLGNRKEAISYYEKALDTYSIYGDDKNDTFSKEEIYDRLATLRGN